MRINSLFRLQILAVIICCSLTNLSFSQNDNSKLKLIYDNDRNSRNSDEINWDSLVVEDSIRLFSVFEMVKSNELKTANDFYRAALIFQHGDDSSAYGMAIVCMKRAIELDSSISKWMLAAAIDRELMSRNKPQIYGTQFIKKGRDGMWERYLIDSTVISDKERVFYGVETLEQQHSTIREMNLKAIIGVYQVTPDIDSILQFILNEKAKGLTSFYAVSESAINHFGYQLLKLNQPQDALRIFQLNASLFPSSYNAYDSLGECLTILKRKRAAINAYRKSLDLNPLNRNAKSKIELLIHK